MVRESKDHGPYNSWDRVPYITNLRYGRASIVPADRHIHHNFVIANYNSEGAIDTDDGSAYYRTHHNFFACKHRLARGRPEPACPTTRARWPL